MRRNSLLCPELGNLEGIAKHAYSETVRLCMSHDSIKPNIFPTRVIHCIIVSLYYCIIVRLGTDYQVILPVSRPPGKNEEPGLDQPPAFLR